ncbi:AfsR/SARP family transcriptional regulator [Nocardioides terrigena]|uniref:AfsR/SARP family transcriptional regulator n=1 Tax=Nocardioides terrigena TaxID=424797 RepID=UPI00131F389A|nr:BTAD domain-containing putative transcriptional regulator [Nocardioides terrigena]
MQGYTDGVPLRASVRLLGGFEVMVEDRIVDLPVSAQRLVAVLALHHSWPRSRIAGTLWPHSSELSALNCLRTTVWRVNRAAPGLIRSGVRAIELHPKASVDVTEVAERLRAVLGPCCSSDDPCDAWDVGDLTTEERSLLPEWDECWLAPERERLHQLWLHGLEAQANRLLKSGAFGRALDLALASVDSDPLRESAHRVVIAIHLAEGNIAQARAAYSHCVRVLEEELGVEPSPQTRAMLVGRRANYSYTPERGE